MRNPPPAAAVMPTHSSPCPLPFSLVVRAVRLTTLSSPLQSMFCPATTRGKHRANLGLCLGYYCGECLMRALCFKWTPSQVLRSVRLTTLQPSPVNVLTRQTLGKHRANLGLCLGYYCGECLMRIFCILTRILTPSC
jgi:hypothetical protein